jgi:hypothetical protein
MTVDFEKKLATLRANLADKVEYGTKQEAKWAESFAADPVYALSWSRSLFGTVADKRVAIQLIAEIDAAQEKGIKAEAIMFWTREYLQKEILRGASNVPSSTSQTSNLMDGELTAAAARLLQNMNWYS